MSVPLPEGLLAVITKARYLLLDFDGPICDIFAGLPAATVAAKLKGLLAGNPEKVPDEVASSEDPLQVFAYAAGVDAELGARVEAEMTELEAAAVASAKPTAYVHDVISACRESGRTVAVVSNNSERAVCTYLARQSLDGGIDLVVARTSHDAALLKPSPHLISTALAGLGAEPGSAALVGDTDTDIQAGRLAAVPVIGYANRPGKREMMTGLGADAVVDSLADLVLALRARPATV